MAKVSFSKLGLKINQDIKTIEFNDQIIEVKQYLPVNNKLELITNVINLSADQNNFANPVKIELFMALEIINFYTNINFTEKQKEDPVKLYDLFISSGLFDKICEIIPEDEYYSVIYGVDESIKAVYEYKNSVLGILENISTDYSNLDFDATEIQQKLGNAENIEFLKEVLTKLG